MLDEYQEEQKVIYTILKNAVEKRCYAHAYLFETNGYDRANDLALAFAKYLLCPKHYSNYDSCKNCKQCNLIDQKIFSEIKIIEPDGMWIKKEQLDDLQKDFTKTAIQSNIRIYIIHNVEKMNLSAANSILKFLEEPAPNIIAILLTDNIYQLLDTIVSRCQIVSFAKVIKQKNTVLERIKDVVYLPHSIEELDLEKYINAVVKFVEFYENKGEETLLYTHDLWHAIIDDRDKTLLAFQLLTLLYKDIFNFKVNRKIEFYEEYVSIIQMIASKNDSRILGKKIKIIEDMKQKIKLNMNQDLLIDQYILEMGCTT